MVNQNDAFLKRLLATFRLEAEEHLRAMSSLLLALETVSDADESRSQLETLFREAHSLKGAARAVNLSGIESVCQLLEDVLAELKSRRVPPSPGLFDTLHQVVDGLGGMLAETGTRADIDNSRASHLATLLKRARQNQAAHGQPLDAVSASPPAQPSARRKPGGKKNQAAATDVEKANTTVVPASPEGVPPAPAETVRIATARLDSLLLQTEELLSVKHLAGQRATELRALGDALRIWGKEWTRMYRDARGMQRALEKTAARNGAANGMEQQPEIKKLVETLERGDLLARSFDNRIALLTKAVEQDHRLLGGMVDNLLDDTKKTLMLPFATLLEVFPKLVRDLTRDRGKEAELRIKGAEIEIDKRLLEEMKDPLMHLLRNGIDHGIEEPAMRQRLGKPPRGKLAIAIAPRHGGKIEILVSDDGAGIDTARVRSAVVRHGIATEAEAEQVGELETLGFIFRSGVSTSPIITDISGRGLGLAIVREKVEKLGGTIAVTSQPGAGTRFHIALPLTLATFRGLLVQAGEHVFVIPMASVERVARVRGEDVKTVENRATIQIEEQTLALVQLADVLELPRRAKETSPGAVAVILGLGTQRIAFQVDVVQGEQEILVKPLGAPLERVRNIAGATVLGTGRCAPVLNVSDLIRSAVRASAAPPQLGTAEAAATRKSILVAEDSITTRMLVKNILEAAGYDVKTAVDGAEAFALLKTGRFDLVVSDVEMPRMDGFDLTVKIRADKNLSGLPVVLVTALESREHRERGIDAGANAYIVKSSFDQSNLLEVIRRLL